MTLVKIDNSKEMARELGKLLYGIDPDKAKEIGICIDCREPALDKCYSLESVKEYYISGLCEKCYDKIFE
jgi:hypothetical protein